MTTQPSMAAESGGRGRLLEELPAADVYYPESDGLPMGESELHIREILRLLATLDAAFASRPDLYVGADLMVYFEEGNPGAVVAPDVMVAVGVPKLPLRRSYRVWREGAPPTFVIEVTSRSSSRDDREFKPLVYAEMSVQEYVLYDPNGEYLRPALQGFRLHDGAYQEMRIAPDGALLSEALGLHLYLEGGRLRLRDAASGAVLLDPEERAAIAETRIAELEKELTRLRERGPENG